MQLLGPEYLPLMTPSTEKEIWCPLPAIAPHLSIDLILSGPHGTVRTKVQIEKNTA